MCKGKPVSETKREIFVESIPAAPPTAPPQHREKAGNFNSVQQELTRTVYRHLQAGADLQLQYNRS